MAYMWFKLGAMKEGAAEGQALCRCWCDLLREKFLSASQVADAEKLAKEWEGANPRMEAEMLTPVQIYVRHYAEMLQRGVPPDRVRNFILGAIDSLDERSSVPLADRQKMTRNYQQVMRILFGEEQNPTNV
jgi:hypothetical protein